MSKVLVINAGSSSLKFQLFKMPKEECLVSGLVGRIGFEDSNFKMDFNDKKVKKTLKVKNHTEATKLLLDALLEYKVVKDLKEIKAAGHRIVHGGELFSSSVVVTDKVAKNIKEISDLAPLHNPAHISGYEALKKVLPNIGHVFVFDTAFHSTMPKEEYLYPLPYEYYEKYAVRKYGFHGTSHYYVSNEAIKLLNKKDTKIITCHIGNGASLAAVKNGKCIATSMGFTPLSGIMMGTRCGDVDPTVVTYMMKKKGMSAEEVLDVFNKKSGLLGVSELSSDSRDIEEAMEKGNKKAILAYDKFVNTIVERIGSYFVKLGGCDAIVFTAGIGENSPLFRSMVIEKLEEALNVRIDKEKNNIRGKFKEISTNDSLIKVFIIPTNEELIIARDTVKLLGI
jgi:acetate kinase